jgi:REP element-mobilizing transposase RayT
MARTSRIRKDSANYHIMSRTNAKAFLFDDGRIKSSIVGILQRVAAFSGVKLHAYCIMDDHFHIVCNITKSETPISEQLIIERIGILKGRAAAEDFAKSLSAIRKTKSHKKRIEEELNRWRVRMEDVSEFTKTFKELVNIAYKKNHPYCGSIWSGRFTSTIIESGEYLRNCIRYVEYNPVRARMVTQAKDYAWSSQNATAAHISMESVPMEDEWVMRRWVQIGSGKIFGSAAFVAEMLGLFADRVRSRSARARAVDGVGFASHGWRLAAMLDAAA